MRRPGQQSAGQQESTQRCAAKRRDATTSGRDVLRVDWLTLKSPSVRTSPMASPSITTTARNVGPMGIGNVWPALSTICSAWIVTDKLCSREAGNPAARGASTRPICKKSSRGVASADTTTRAADAALQVSSSRAAFPVQSQSDPQPLSASPSSSVGEAVAGRCPVQSRSLIAGT